MMLQREKSTGLDRYIFLNGLKGRDPALFYQLLLANMPVCALKRDHVILRDCQCSRVNT